MASTALAKNAERLNDDMIAGINSFTDVEAFCESIGQKPVDAAEYIPSLTILRTDEEKKRLIGTPFVILEAQFNDGKYAGNANEGKGFVSLTILLESGDKYIVNDGGTGIRDQMIGIIASRVEAKHPHPNMMILCKRGLSVSEYYRNEVSGDTSRTKPDGDEWKFARTFYLA